MMNSPGRQVRNMLLEISGEITPERMKRWSQSKNNTLLFTWGQTMVEIMKIMLTSFKRSHAHCCTQCPRPCSRPLLTHASTGESWTATESLA